MGGTATAERYIAPAHRPLVTHPLAHEDTAEDADAVRALTNPRPGIHAAVPMARTHLMLVDATPSGHASVAKRRAVGGGRRPSQRPP